MTNSALKLRQRRDDVLDHAVGEVVLFRITAHVGEWQNSDGGLIRKAEGWLAFWRTCLSRLLRGRTRHLLQRPRAFHHRAVALVIKPYIHPIPDLIENHTRQATAPRIRDVFGPRCSLDAIVE